jgi:hypothetical protein
VVVTVVARVLGKQLLLKLEQVLREVISNRDLTLQHPLKRPVLRPPKPPEVVVAPKREVPPPGLGQEARTP